MNNPSSQRLSRRSWHCLQQNALTVARQPHRELPDLSEIRVLDWADAFFATHGDWPRWDSGPIPGSSGETWYSVSAAFVLGQRGIRPARSLASFFAHHERVRCNLEGRRLTVGQIMAWAKTWPSEPADGPGVRSGPIPGQGGLTWYAVSKVVWMGLAGRPAGTSLSLLRRSEVALAEQSPLTIERILDWVDVHRERTGAGPSRLPAGFSMRQANHGSQFPWHSCRLRAGFSDARHSVSC